MHCVLCSLTTMSMMVWYVLPPVQRAESGGVVFFFFNALLSVVHHLRRAMGPRGLGPYYQYVGPVVGIACCCVIVVCRPVIASCHSSYVYYCI